MSEARRRCGSTLRRRARMNAFDQFLADTRGDFSTTVWRQPVIEITDTMYVCKKWFECHDVPFTAADLLAMKRLVFERERSIREEETSP
jgi:hypothetical protein